ncbi:DMT family transporter [Nonomuraea sp. NBC_01738]|nr:DMT family transporter [Nonomuraea sp. NBC_01738]
MRHRTHLAGLALALTSAWCFGFAGVAAKALDQAGVGPMQAVWGRLLLGSCLLVPYSCVFRRQALRIPRSLWPAIAAYGLLAVAGAQGMFFASVSRVPVGVAMLVVYTAPILVLIWARFVWRRRISWLSVAGAGLAALGLAAVVQVWSGIRVDPLGLLFAFSAACCLAAYFLLSESLAAVDPIALLVWGLGIGALALTPLAAPWNVRWSALLADVDVGPWQVPAAVVLAWLVLVSTIAAYATGVAAVRRLSSPLASVLASLEVLVSAVVAFAVLGERLAPVQWAGMLLVLGGSVLTHRAATGTRPAKDTTAPRPTRELATTGSAR